MCSQHLDLFQLFEHGKGNLINCMAQTLIRMINAIVGPTKMYFGEKYPFHHKPNLMQNLSESYFFDKLGNRGAFHDKIHRGREQSSHNSCSDCKVAVAGAPTHLRGGSKK